ncbi:MAG: cell division protein ZapA [Burkholderiaceae bacterium]|jgi:cell division protein ZapA|nr:cell division protein ZapA [Burkholderiaceae bacterium]
MEHLTVTILEREYRLACTPEEKESLLKCASYVDGRMQAIRAAGKVMGADRIAVMAALQIAHDLMSARGGDGIDTAELQQRIRAMTSACEEALLPQEKLF